MRIEGLSDIQFQALYGTEEACQQALIAARLASGMICPKCAHPRIYHDVGRQRFGCNRCPNRWSYTAGTVMRGTALPLTTWFLAMHLMSSTKQGISSIELARRLGVRQTTAWYMQKRLRAAMTDRDGDRPLGGPPPDGGCRLRSMTSLSGVCVVIKDGVLPIKPR